MPPRTPANCCQISDFPSNCGIKIVHDFELVDDTGEAIPGQKIFDSFIRRVRARDFPAIVVFSDVDDGDAGGHKLAAFIAKRGLGDVQISEPANNRHSGNDIVCWLWYPDQDAVNSYIAVLNHPATKVTPLKAVKRSRKR